MKRLLLMLLAVVAVAGMAASDASAGVTPPSFTGELLPGESVTIDKLVDVPASPEKADVYFLADTTGSMGTVINSVKANAASVMASIQGSISDVQFGAGDYKDFPYDGYAFKQAAGIGLDDGIGGTFDASDAISGWFASGGADGPEGQFYALDQIGDGADPAGINWRPGATRIVVWFGDAPGHDPVCSGISGLGYDITEASLTAKLVGSGVTVVAISTNTGYPNALDDNPIGFDYSSACGAPGGSSGQGTRIAAATGGVHLTGINSATIAGAIVSGIDAITFDITAQAVGCDPLVISWSPASHEDVTGPTTVGFTETISVPGDAASGTVICTVEFLASGSVIAVQDISVTITGDTTAPELACTPTVNPHGSNVPKAGEKSKGQNEDGFYQVSGSDDTDGSVEIWVTDANGSGPFGPFAGGDNIKFTEAPGATPSSKSMGSGNGQAGAVAAHVTLTGDPIIMATDAAGNTSTVSCLVPPQPK